MASDHEKILYVVKIAFAKTIKTYVFRTRQAARAFVGDKMIGKNPAKAAEINQAVWGPDN